MVLNGVTLDRLGDRRQLLTSFDRFRREVDATGMMTGIDAFNEQAFGLLTSSKLLDALDLQNEDPKVVERYGKGDPKPRDDGHPKLMEHFLVARRLVEAGARCVTLAFSRWDHHGDNFGALRQDLPLLDQGVSALVEDLHAARARQGRLRRRLGRVRPHAEDQQGRRPRPLAQRLAAPCSPAAA